MATSYERNKSGFDVLSKLIMELIAFLEGVAKRQAISIVVLAESMLYPTCVR